MTFWERHNIFHSHFKYWNSFSPFIRTVYLWNLWKAMKRNLLITAVALCLRTITKLALWKWGHFEGANTTLKNLPAKFRAISVTAVFFYLFNFKIKLLPKSFHISWFPAIVWNASSHCVNLKACHSNSKQRAWKQPMQCVLFKFKQRAKCEKAWSKVSFWS